MSENDAVFLARVAATIGQRFLEDREVERLHALATARSTWSYDMDAAPKDGTRIMLACHLFSLPFEGWWRVKEVVEGRWKTGWFTAEGFAVDAYAWKDLPHRPAPPSFQDQD